MKKSGSSWGDCKYRDLFPVYFGRMQRSNWLYICKKTGKVCEPDYCLGPDEDNLKGEPDEEQLDQ